MRQILCGVRDIPARSMIGIPMLFKHPAVATRWFGDLINSKESVVAQHPRDYELVQYGEYDDEADTFDGIEPLVLLTGAQLLDAQEGA